MFVTQQELGKDREYKAYARGKESGLIKARQVLKLYAKRNGLTRKVGRLMCELRENSRDLRVYSAVIFFTSFCFKIIIFTFIKMSGTLSLYVI